jgi:hypothetical protein
MKLKQLIWTSLLALTLAACGGGGGSPAAPPIGGIKFLNGDNQITLSWDNSSGVYYWVWYERANDPSLNISSPGLGDNEPSGGSPNIFSDYVMAPVINGYWYSYAVNAHAGNPTGPGGPQSNVVVATPRWAGSAWQACANITPSIYPTASVYGSPVLPLANCPSTNLNAVTFGSNGTGSTSYPGWPIRWFLAVGDNGKMYTSSVGVLGSNIPSTPVTNNGSYNVTSAKVGLGNWFPLTTNNSACGSGNLHGVAYGWSTFVAVGDSGKICFSGSTAQNSSPNLLVQVDAPDTANWFVPDSWYPIYGGAQVTYSTGYSGVTLNGTALANVNFTAVSTNQTAWNASGGNFVAVGTHGTIVESGDGKNWYNTAMATALGGSGTATAAPFSLTATSNTLNAAAYNSCSYHAYTSNGVAPWTWIAVGDGGSMMFSTDASGYTNWYTGATNSLVSIPSTSSSLRGIACSPNASVGYGTFAPPATIQVWVVVGDNGLVWISYDGLTWAVPSSSTTHNSYTGFTYPGFSVNGSAATVFPENMTSITYGTRFVATGVSGTIYVSVDGLTWNSTNGTIPKNPSCVGSSTDPYCLAAQQNPITSVLTALDAATYATGSGVSVALKAVAHVPGSLVPAGNYGYVPFGYIAVGAGGAVTFSQ